MSDQIITDMPSLKLCKKCNIEKSPSEYYPSYQSSCKKCHYNITLKWHRKNPRVIELRRKYRKKFPWLSILLHINWRCNNPKSTQYKWYGAKGIKNYLTLEDVKSLWIRDNASSMKRASIDRLDSNKNYEVSNCRFIESSENSRRRFCKN